MPRRRKKSFGPLSRLRPYLPIVRRGWFSILAPSKPGLGRISPPLGRNILISAWPLAAQNFFRKNVFFLALPWVAAVEAGASEKYFPEGIRIVIDVENQL
jgi:hypothetical protein